MTIKAYLNIIFDVCMYEGLSPFSMKLPQLIGYSKHFNNDNRYVK